MGQGNVSIVIAPVETLLCSVQLKIYCDQAIVRPVGFNIEGLDRATRMHGPNFNLAKPCMVPLPSSLSALIA